MKVDVTILISARPGPRSQAECCKLNLQYRKMQYFEYDQIQKQKQQEKSPTVIDEKGYC